MRRLSSSTGFRLWKLVARRSNLRRTKSHRRKPALLLQQAWATALLVFYSVAFTAAAPQSGNSQASVSKSAASTPKRDLSGLWHYQSTGASEPVAPDKLIPPMTPWAQSKFDAEIPGYGPRRAPGGNDPMLQCDPTGLPRVMFLNTPFEFVQLPGRVIQFFEHEHEYRTIWTDGRTLPSDADPRWYGYAIGRWEGDDTLVVDSSGFRESTWLGSTGYPHSEEMRITERYHRMDHDTILYDITITDPKAYTRPIVGPQRTMKLRPHDELVEEICVPSEEKSFAERVAEPAVPKRTK
jgi:hypothetical protein